MATEANNQLKAQAITAVDRLTQELRTLSLQIHTNPEIGYQERLASSLLSARLEAAGFSVERGVAGLETAFTADIRSGGSGPKVAIMAEFDALPGLGHACGHNIIATAALGAALA